MRQIEISREEAELLTDLLLLSEHHCARDISATIRERFGMVSESKEQSWISKWRPQMQGDAVMPDPASF